MCLLFRHFLHVTGCAGPGVLSGQGQLGATTGCALWSLSHCSSVSPAASAPSLSEASLWCSGGSTAEGCLSLGQVVLSYRGLERQPIPRNSLDLCSGEWMQMCLNKWESYEGGEVGRQILFFWCKPSTILMFRRTRLAVTIHPLQGIVYSFLLAWLFIKPPVLKTQSHLMWVPAKAEKRLGI